MDLLSHLSELGDGELEAITSSRPEAAEFRRRPRSRLPMLAMRLGTRHAIYAAVSRLARFHYQLLQLACVFDGSLSPGRAASQGVPPDAFAPAAWALAARALAFPHEGRLEVPPEVQEVVTSFDLGLPLRRLLEQENADELKCIAQAIGVPGGRKAQLVEAILDKLSDPDCVRSLLEDAPPASRRALDAVRAAGREATISGLTDELGRAVYEFRQLYSRRSRTKDDSGLLWLWSRGLVFKESWEGLIGVPAPVEVALRGRAFETWETEPPGLELTPVAFDRSPLSVVEEMSRLVLSLDRTEMQLLKSGEIGVRELRRVTTEVGLDEESVRRLLATGRGAGLVDLRSEVVRPAGRRRKGEPLSESHAMIATDAGCRWVAAEVATAWLTLFKPWAEAMTKGPEALSEVVEAIAGLPVGQGATVASLARRLCWLRPATWRDDETAAGAVVEVRAALAYLGVAPSSGPVAVSELGRAALAGCDAADVRPLLPVATERCTVQADMTVIVGGPPSVALGTALGQFGDLVSSGAAHVYRLDERSDARAVDRGMTAGEIERLLADRSDSGLPGPVRELIRDVGRRHGRLRVGPAAVPIVAEDAAVLAHALGTSKVRGLGARLVAPTVALIEGRTQAQVVEALRAAGLMPAVDGPKIELAVEPAAPVEEAARPRRRKPETDPELLDRRRQALARARAARAKR